MRGLAVCSPKWDEVNEIIAAANIYTIKNVSDRIFGFSPIPAMCKFTHPVRAIFPDRWCLRSVLRLVLRPACGFPQTWGEQTDVPESADWYNSTHIIVTGSSLPTTRTPMPILPLRRYNGTKIIAMSPTMANTSNW